MSEVLLSYSPIWASLNWQTKMASWADSLIIHQYGLLEHWTGILVSSLDDLPSLLALYWLIKSSVVCLGFRTVGIARVGIIFEGSWAMDS